jgi:hypothetical protein
MTPRPALYWTVKKEAYGTSFEVMRVTRVAPRQIYGSVDGLPTHCRLSDAHGSFATEESAKAAVDKIRAAYHSFDIEIKAAQQKLAALYTLREETTKRATKEAILHANA